MGSCAHNYCFAENYAQSAIKVLKGTLQIGADSRAKRLAISELQSIDETTFRQAIDPKNQAMVHQDLINLLSDFENRQEPELQEFYVKFVGWFYRASKQVMDPSVRAELSLWKASSSIDAFRKEVNIACAWGRVEPFEKPANFLRLIGESSNEDGKSISDAASALRAWNSRVFRPTREQLVQLSKQIRNSTDRKKLALLTALGSLVSRECSEHSPEPPPWLNARLPVLSAILECLGDERTEVRFQARRIVDLASSTIWEPTDRVVEALANTMQLKRVDPETIELLTSIAGKLAKPVVSPSTMIDLLMATQDPSLDPKAREGLETLAHVAILDLKTPRPDALLVFTRSSFISTQQLAWEKLAPFGIAPPIANQPITVTRETGLVETLPLASFSAGRHADGRQQRILVELREALYYLLEDQDLVGAFHLAGDLAARASNIREALTTEEGSLLFRQVLRYLNRLRRDRPQLLRPLAPLLDELQLHDYSEFGRCVIAARRLAPRRVIVRRRPVLQPN